MKTIQEVMQKYHLTKANYANSEGGSYYTVENIEAAMAEYAGQFKVKNLAQPDVSGSISCDDMEDIIERFYLNHKTGTIENWLIAHPETKIIICEIMDKRNKKYYR